MPSDNRILANEVQPAEIKHPLAAEVVRILQGLGLHLGLGILNPPEYDLVKAVEDQELGEKRIRLLYVACTRARDLLVFPHYLGELGNCWYEQVDLQLDHLPELPTLDLAEGERKPTLASTHPFLQSVRRTSALQMA